MFEINAVRDNRTGDLVQISVLEDESIEILTTHERIDDPCLTLFRYNHPNASLHNMETAIKLEDWYNQICNDDEFDKPTPGELMIGKKFTVQCWNTTHFPDTEQAMVGQYYTATIEEFYGFGTNGFVIQELGMIVDTALMALQHFVIA